MHRDRRPPPESSEAVPVVAPMAGGRLVIGSSYGPAGASTRVRALDWMRFLGLEAQVLDYLGTPNVRPGTLLRQPWGVVTAERRLRSLRREDPWERLLGSPPMGPLTRGGVEAGPLGRAGRGGLDLDDPPYPGFPGGGPPLL